MAGRGVTGKVEDKRDKVQRCPDRLSARKYKQKQEFWTSGQEIHIGIKKIRKEADCACVICACAYIGKHCPSCPLVLKIDWFIETVGDRKCGKI